jgi:8-oxo-dGTP pyrophosphatase MutT (NUDIX family)
VHAAEGGRGAVGDEGFSQTGEEQLFSGHLISLVRGHFRDPDGEDFDREIVRHPGAVAVVPLHDDGTVTLVRQFRAAVGRSLLEAPAGTCDVAGEDPATTARRELAEEAGLAAGRLEHLVTFYNSPGYTNQQTLVYLARELSPCATDRAGTEERFMDTQTVRLAEVTALAEAGELVDAQTLLGLELARRRLEEA